MLKKGLLSMKITEAYTSTSYQNNYKGKNTRK